MKWVTALLGEDSLQQFADSNRAEEDEFLKAIKIRSLTSFGGEVKPSAPCRKILPLPSMRQIFRWQHSREFLAKFLLHCY
jgi:hypothetical protein